VYNVFQLAELEATSTEGEMYRGWTVKVAKCQ